jgi:RES domain-containing protein
MEVFRISLAMYSALIPSGRAARWNSKGVDMIYTASSRSLACLESVVHRNRTDLLDNFKILVIYVPNNLSTEVINISGLPEDWHNTDSSAPHSCQTIGDKWAIGKTSLTLAVPSSIVKDEKNSKLFQLIINLCLKIKRNKQMLMSINS